ncbi:MAG: S49 family peptidase [bacterium]
MPEPTDTNIQNKPIIIQKTPQSKFSRTLVGVLGCLGSCFGVLVIFIFILSAFVGIVASSAGVALTENVVQAGTVADKIAIIPLNGVIVDDFGSTNDIFNLNSVITPEQINGLLNIAVNDDNVKAIILRENTPGGSTLAMQKICNKVKLVNSTKPVYTYIESIGASAGYFIANCSKYIISYDYAITGSIGALMEFTDMSGLFDKLGIKNKVVTNTKGTQKESDVFSNNSVDEKKYKQILDDIFENFIKQIMEGRNSVSKDKITEEKLRTFATGEVFSGKQAKELGLVDDIGMIEDAIKIVKAKEVLASGIGVIEYRYQGGWMFNSMSGLKGMLGLNALVNLPVGGIYSIEQGF